MSAVNANAALAASYGGISPAVPTHWPNTFFTPPVGAMWVKPFFKWNPAIPHTNFAEGLSQTTGFGQFDILGPTGKGEAAHNVIADQICAMFPVGSKHEWEGTEVTIISIGKVGSHEEDKYWKSIVSFTARFFSHIDTARNALVVPDFVAIFNEELTP